MRVIRTAGVGLAVAASAAAASAQSPARPAASFGRIRAVEPAAAVTPGVQPAGLVVPGAAPAPGYAPAYLPPGYPLPGYAPPQGYAPPPAYPVYPGWPVAYQGAPAPGAPLPGDQLQKPKPLPAPSVTEQRAPAAGPPAATLTVPHGTPVPYTPAVPGTPMAAGVVDPYLCAPPPILPGGTPVPTDVDPALVGGPAAGAVGPIGPLGLLTGPGRFRLNGEFLLWWVAPLNVPPLVTTSGVASAGVLGRPDTRVLFGGTNVDSAAAPGGRFGGEYWFGARQVWGLDGDLFFLQPGGNTRVFTSATDPVLARPFTNINQAIPFSEFVTAPGLAVGSVAVDTETSMWGAQLNLRRYIGSTSCARLDAFGGFRFLNLSEELRVTESFTRVPGAGANIGVANALSGTVVDRFKTENDFYGAQLGLAGELRRGRWFAEGRAAVAMGTVHQQVDISGNQTVQFTDGPRQFAGGLLALPGANIGVFKQEKFGVVPEVTLKLGYHLTDHWRFSVGYNFLYLNSVLRPGEQIDPGLDVTRIPNFPLPGNPAPTLGRPMVPLKDSGVTAQGVSFTLTYTW